jgi:hypothetical protein
MMKIYANVIAGESEFRYSKLIVQSKSKSLFSENPFVDSFPSYILNLANQWQLNGRKGYSLLDNVKEGDFKLKLSENRRFRKSKMPDLTWYQRQDLIIASEDFKKVIQPFVNNSVEWIFLGTVNGKNYYLMNFLVYHDTFDFLQSDYITYAEFSKGIFHEMKRVHPGFETPELTELNLPQIFFSIKKHVFRKDEVEKCPLFLLRNPIFGRESIYFTDQVLNVIRQHELNVEGSVYLAAYSV